MRDVVRLVLSKRNGSQHVHLVKRFIIELNRGSYLIIIIKQQRRDGELSVYLCNNV